METLVRYGPLVVFAVTVLSTVFVRDWMQRKRYGTSGLVLFKTPGLIPKLRDGLMSTMELVAFVHSVVAAVAPAELVRIFGQIPGLASTEIGVVGVLVMVISTALMFIAQLHMGKSWRIGIDSSARPGLITNGMFRFSRNPIFSMMLLFVVGLMLAIPTWSSLGIIVFGWIVLRIHIAAEERHLLVDAYGEEYRAYARRVGRFTPWLGRLA